MIFVSKNKLMFFLFSAASILLGADQGIGLKQKTGDSAGSVGIVSEKDLPVASGEMPQARAIADKILFKEMTDPEIKLPNRLYSPQLRQMIKDGKVGSTFAVQGAKPETGAKWLAVSDERWKEMFAPYAPVSIYAVRGDAGSGKCPFCGKIFKGCWMTVDEVLTHPFQANTKCCDATVYEREADMPPDYKARPNHTEPIPHLDGTTFPYRFYCPPGTENAPFFITPGMTDLQIVKDSPRRQWFCSAGEVWMARMRTMFSYGGTSATVGKVFESLAARVFYLNDDKAVHALTVIYDRLSEIYPGLPLYSAWWPLDFARGRDNSTYLTQKEYRDEVPRYGEKVAFWYQRNTYNFDKLNWGVTAWHDGVVSQAGMLAEVFDLIRDNPEVKRYSLEKYGDAGIWEKRVYEHVIKEAQRVAASGRYFPTGNTTENSMKGNVKLGIVCQDPNLFKYFRRNVEGVVANGLFSDGVSIEGSAIYAGMGLNTIQLGKSIYPLFGFPDISVRHPFTAQMNSAPIKMLYGTEPSYGDSYVYAGFLGTWAGNWKQKPTQDGYAAHEVSQCFPDYGIACVRAGGPGHRLEATVDFQNTVGHAHLARLNLECFYEGIRLLPDLGYTIGATADPSEAPWKDLTYPFPILPIPKNSGANSGWAWMNYTPATDVHCVAQVDRIPHQHGPCRFLRFLGGQRPDTPGYFVQFIDVDALGLFNGRETKPARPDIDQFERQTIALTLPGGQAVLVDIHRLHGGQRHDLLWQVPSGIPRTSLGEPKPLPTNILTYLDPTKKVNPEFSSCYEGSKSVRWTLPPLATWNAEWLIEPHKYAPKSEWALKDYYNPWAAALHDVTLRLWGGAIGSPAASQELLSELRPLPTKMKEQLPGQPTANATVAFKDALNSLVVSRVAEKPGLSTAFVSVLEPRSPDQPPVLQHVEVLPSSDGGDGAGVVLTTAATADEPTQQIYAATTSTASSRYAAKGFELTGRLGVAIPQTRQFVLYDGTRLVAGDWVIESEPGWTLTLIGVVGDLTGTPAESALIVKSTRPLPTDNTLAGTMLTVHHMIKGEKTSGYTIAKVTNLSSDVYRIDLRGTPPFIRQASYVKEYDPGQPRTFVPEYGLKAPGRGDNEGRRLRFPGTGLDLEMSESAIEGWFCKGVLLAEDPPKDAIKVGNPFIIYTIRPGDRVIIPSHVAIKATESTGDLTLDIQSVAPVRLTVPGIFSGATAMAGTNKISLPMLHKQNAVEIELTQAALADGRANLILSRK